MYTIFEELLKQRGLKTSDVVKATGLNATFFSEWKSGKKKNPNIESLQKIADFFNVSVDRLMTGKENEFTVEMAEKDLALTNISERLKDYALKLSKLPKDKQDKILEFIDMLEE